MVTPSKDILVILFNLGFLMTLAKALATRMARATPKRSVRAGTARPREAAPRVTAFAAFVSISIDSLVYIV